MQAEGFTPARLDRRAALERCNSLPVDADRRRGFKLAVCTDATFVDLFATTPDDGELVDILGALLAQQAAATLPQIAFAQPLAAASPKDAAVHPSAPVAQRPAVPPKAPSFEAPEAAVPPPAPVAHRAPLAPKKETSKKSDPVPRGPAKRKAASEGDRKPRAPRSRGAASKASRTQKAPRPGPASAGQTPDDHPPKVDVAPARAGGGAATAAATQSDELVEDEWSAMGPQQLLPICRKHGVIYKGRLETIRKRLRAALRSQSEPLVSAVPEGLPRAADDSASATVTAPGRRSRRLGREPAVADSHRGEQPAARDAAATERSRFDEAPLIEPPASLSAGAKRDRTRRNNENMKLNGTYYAQGRRKLKLQKTAVEDDKKAPEKVADDATSTQPEPVPAPSRVQTRQAKRVQNARQSDNTLQPELDVLDEFLVFSSETTR